MRATNEDEESFEMPLWWKVKREIILRTFACIYCASERSSHMAEKPPGEAQRYQYHCHVCRKITPHREIT